MMDFTIRPSKADVGICARCTHAQVITTRQRQELVLCNSPMNGAVFPGGVLDCNDYKQIDEMDRHEAEQLGWVLEMKGTKIKGFAPPKQEN